MWNRTNFFRAKHENEVEAQRSKKLTINQKCQSLFTWLCTKGKRRLGECEIVFRANRENEVEAQRSEKLPINQKCHSLFTWLCTKYCTGYKFSANKNRIYKQNTHTQSGAENSLFQFWLTITKAFSLFYLEETTSYWSLSAWWAYGLVNSRAVSQLILRVNKPTVVYKLASQ